MAAAAIDRRDTRRTFLPLLTNISTFRLEFMANYISIKEARAKLPREPSVCVTPGPRPRGGQMGNSLSDGGRAAGFKGDAARGMNLLQRVHRKPTRSVPPIRTGDTISHLKQCLINSITAVRGLSGGRCVSKQPGSDANIQQRKKSFIRRASHIHSRDV